MSPLKLSALNSSAYSVPHHFLQVPGRSAQEGVARRQTSRAGSPTTWTDREGRCTSLKSSVWGQRTMQAASISSAFLTMAAPWGLSSSGRRTMSTTTTMPAATSFGMKRSWTYLLAASSAAAHDPCYQSGTRRPSAHGGIYVNGQRGAPSLLGEVRDCFSHWRGAVSFGRGAEHEVRSPKIREGFTASGRRQGSSR